MLLTILTVIALSFSKNKQIFSIPFFIISFFIIIFSLTMYYKLGNMNGLNHWLATGRHHYELLVQVERLGGIDGIIKRLHAKLQENPNDVKGWEILAKLYSAKGDQVNAEKSLKHLKRDHQDSLP
jgi:cytochrome c-type biogenesis protein CcmH/NrfG